MEDDRSTKKVKRKDDREVDSRNDSGEVAMELGEDKSEPSHFPFTDSFKSKLLSGTVGSQNRCSETEDMVLKEDNIVVSTNGPIPPITFLQRVKSLISKNMENTVVVRLLGRQIGYKTLLDKISKLWKPTGLFKIVDLESNFYLVKLASAQDYQRALLDGPWVVFGHYLTVQPWSSNFSPTVSKITKTFVWVRIPGLSFGYYHKNLLRVIGELIGQVLHIDYNTEVIGRGRFARMAVLVDLTRPLISRILVDGNVHIVEYEGLPAICYYCGKYGHLLDHCKDRKSAMTFGQANPTRNHQQNFERTKAKEKDVRDNFGPWM